MPAELLRRRPDIRSRRATWRSRSPPASASPRRTSIRGSRWPARSGCGRRRRRRRVGVGSSSTDRPAAVSAHLRLRPHPQPHPHRGRALPAVARRLPGRRATRRAGSGGRADRLRQVAGGRGVRVERGRRGAAFGGPGVRAVPRGRRRLPARARRHARPCCRRRTPSRRRGPRSPPTWSRFTKPSAAAGSCARANRSSRTACGRNGKAHALGRSARDAAGI